MLSAITHIHQRRGVLRSSIDIDRSFRAWEESCVPSYCHRNLPAAYASWWRLFRAVQLARRDRPQGGAALDFGASVGELAHLLGSAWDYAFIEENEQAAGCLQQQLPRARRATLAGIARGAYDCIFAIDALEHNDDYAMLIDRLADGLSPGGVLIISGPTETWLYKLGRRIAGFEGHYHKTTIFEIEAAAARRLVQRDLATIVPGLPLFRLSVWSGR